jgi:hypothetical protein
MRQDFVFPASAKRKSRQKVIPLLHPLCFCGSEKRHRFIYSVLCTDVKICTENEKCAFCEAFQLSVA